MNGEVGDENDASALIDKPYLSHDYREHVDIFFTENRVKAGKLPALVERLTHHNTYDASFVQSFLLTYRSFTTSIELYHLLLRRYTIEIPTGLNTEETEEWIRVKRTPIRIR